MNLRRTKSAKISNNFQQFKEEVREELQEKSAEILELKEKLEDVEQQCYDIVSKNDFRGQDGQMSFESLKQWVTLSLDGVNTQMDELKDIVSLVTGNFTSETYRGDLKLHYELLERFHDVTYQLGDLNSRVDNLQEHLISLGSSDNVNGTTVTTLKGEPGMPGTAGLPGYDGLPGPKGDSGRPGEKGDQGLPGLDGPKGDKGKPGDLAGCNKLESCKGEKGAVGPQGRLGRRGFRGPKGDRGEKGIMAVSVQDLRENDIDFLIGEPGYPGRPGQPGQRGSKGNKGDKGSATAAGFLLTRHSQSSVAPDCLATMTKLWVGYSLLSLGGRTSSTQDLGGAGSCILSFKVLALQSCSGDKCKLGDTSHWLSTMPRGDESARTSGRKAEKLVSRCVVCEVPSNAIAVHSQGALIPDCPSGWTSVWTGYSFLKVSSMSAGQDLSSPGSCLEEFSHQPVTKCTDGTCFYDKDDNGLWLSAKMNKENAPSRCSVCINT